MLSRGHVGAGGATGMEFGVPVQAASEFLDYVPDNPFDFPPGSAGSKPPMEIPKRIQAIFRDIGQGHTLAWQPVLRRLVLWKKKRRIFGESTDLSSMRTQLVMAGYSPHEVALVVDPLIRSDQSGWTCCFVLQNPFDYPWAGIMPGAACPPDNRFLAMLYDSDPDSYGGVRAMREHVKARHNEDVISDEKRKRDRFLEQHDAARTLTRISNIAPGNRSLLQNNPDLAARTVEIPDI